MKFHTRLFTIVRVFITLIILLHSCFAYTQNFISDTAAEASLLKSPLNLYHRFLSPQTGLYNGSEYAYNTYYPFIINQGDPFFKSKNFDTGAVFYNNILYEKVALLYDIIKGELLTHDPGNMYILRLNSEEVGWFSLFGRTFVRLIHDNAGNQVLRTGFYDLLYNGNAILYKKISKKFNENSSSFQGINKYVVESNEYFIKLNNRYHEVHNKKSVLLIMNNKKKQLVEFIRKNRLNFRKEKEISLMKSVAFYDSINNDSAKPVNQSNL